jgi:hypothetical protein
MINGMVAGLRGFEEGEESCAVDSELTRVAFGQEGHVNIGVVLSRHKCKTGYDDTCFFEMASVEETLFPSRVVLKLSSRLVFSSFVLWSFDFGLDLAIQILALFYVVRSHRGWIASITPATVPKTPRSINPHHIMQIPTSNSSAE